MGGQRLDNRVVIIGAGIAGLVCAYELEARGFDCTVLEAQPNHVGGRIRTVSFGNTHGRELIGELGAMRIPLNHHKTLAYISELGLKTRKHIYNNERTYCHFRDRKFRRNQRSALTHLFDLPDKPNLYEQLWRRVMTHTPAMLSRLDRIELFSLKPSSDRLRLLDQKTLLDVCEEAGLTTDEIDYLGSQSDISSLLGSAVTEHLREEIDGTWTSGFVELVDGMRKLPMEIATKLRRTIYRGCRVKGIIDDPEKDGVVVSYTYDSTQNQIHADRVVCTVPCPVICQIDFTPSLLPGKLRAIRNLHYESAHKVVALCGHRFWEVNDGIFGGFSSTDLRIATTVYPSDNPVGCKKLSTQPSVLLASYAIGQAARNLAILDDDDLEQVVRQDLRRLHENSDILQILRCDWNSQTYAGGAFAFFRPGEHARLLGDLAQTQGRIHFAGEHTSLKHSWIEGAVESAQRVVSDIARNHSHQRIRQAAAV